MAKILLVDDDPLLMRMYQTKFELDGNQIETASDGQQALEIVPKVMPDLILLDMMMPKLNGLQVLENLKANPKLKKIPVIMLTNVSSSETDSEKALELGATTYLVKSDYTPKEIVQKVKEILAATTHELPAVKTVVKKT